MARKHDSSTRVLTFVLTVAFGLLSAVIAYATFKNGSFELRSKAAIEEIILKQWTFDKVTEGWDAKDFLSSTITGGMYKLTVNSMRDLSPRLVNTSVQTILKYPVNKFRIRLSAGSPQLKKIMPSPPQRAYPFTLKVSQKYQGKKVSEIEQQISAVADAKEHEYSFEFPKDSNLKKVDEMQITFVGLSTQAGTFVSINDIALIGMKEVRPTPTKKPPVVMQSLIGYVQRYRSNEFKLVVNDFDASIYTDSKQNEPEFLKSREYLLVTTADPGCEKSKVNRLKCKYITSIRNINFDKYVGKYVTVRGNVIPTSISESEDRNVVKNNVGERMDVQPVIGEQDEGPINYMPIFLVSSIKLAVQKPVSDCKGKVDGTACGGEGTCQPCKEGTVCTLQCVPLNAGVCWKNECVSATTSISPSFKPSPPPPSECYYESVQCVKAPCDPILVCPTDY